MIKFKLKKNLAQQLLFVTSILLLFVIPVFPGFYSWLNRILFTLVVIFSLLSFEKINEKFAVTGVIAIITGWLTKTTDFIYLAYLSEIVSYTFLIWVVGSLILQIIRIKEVSLFGLLEAVNGYLLLGIMFSSFVIFLNKHFPASYSTNSKLLDGIDMVYYTFVTLTTTGYGDIIPATRAAKEMAVLIAVCGQLYVAMIVAILVGKYANKN